MRTNNRLFLCHSAADKPFVRKLANDLKANGLNIWLDEWELKVGDSLRQKIEDGILNSAWLAVILSKNSVASQWVNRELSAAFARELEIKRVFILPLLIDDCEIPVLLRDKLYADFRSDYQSGLHSLLKAIDIKADDFQGSWWGRWRLPVNSPYAGGLLFIYEVDDAGFKFTLSVSSGAHTGEISGAGLFSGDNRAICLKSWESGTCKLQFLMEFDNEPQIVIEEISGCLWFHGAGVDFSGTYKKEQEVLYEYGLLDEKDLTMLYHIQGRYYWAFRDIFYQIGEDDDLDSFPARVYTGGAPGLYTIVEAILIKGDQGELWASFIDYDSDAVRYFTTEPHYKTRLPKTIEHWRSRFPDKPVIFDSPIEFDYEE